MEGKYINMGKEGKRCKINGEKNTTEIRGKENEKWKEDKEKKSYDSKILYLNPIKWLLQNMAAIIAIQTLVLKLQLELKLLIT
jgi:hypothetical protein